MRYDTIVLLRELREMLERYDASMYLAGYHGDTLLHLELANGDCIDFGDTIDVESLTEEIKECGDGKSIRTD